MTRGSSVGSRAAVPKDLRSFIASSLRHHPRVAYQSLCAHEGFPAQLAAALPPLIPFRNHYEGAICILDWDHRLPSESLALRIYAYYQPDTLAAGEESFDDRLEAIGDRDRFPEFDVPDFDHLVADEAYEIEVGLSGEVGPARLTSAWRRNIDVADGERAMATVSASDEFQELVATTTKRPAHLGGLEAVSWTPPCESEHSAWTLDVWYLLAFDGRIGTGRSFLVDLDAGSVVAVRDFSVRTN